jgi:hypothetical protein
LTPWRSGNWQKWQSGGANLKEPLRSGRGWRAIRDAAARPGLKSDKVHAEHTRSDFRSLVGRVSDLYTAALATAARMNLRFDHDNGRFEAVSAFPCLFFGKRDFTARSSNAIARQNCFGLILVNLHQCSVASSVRLLKNQPVLEFYSSQNIEVYSEPDGLSKERAE